MLFAYLLEKPWVKLGSMGVGIYFAQFYMKLLHYRRIDDPVEKKNKYPIIDFMHKSSLLRLFMIAIGISLMVTDLTVGRHAIAYPYSWSMLQNDFYYGLTRYTFPIGGFLVIFSLFMGSFNLVKELMLRPFFLMGGSLCMINALITPLVLQLNFLQAPDGTYITFYMVVTLGVANMILITFFAFLLYILIQYPAEKIFSGIVEKYLSQRKILTAYNQFGKAREEA